jgi:peptide subunit release factor 1 (eRF1)
MKTQVRKAIEAITQAVENYNPTTNNDINCVVTEGLILHLKAESESILNAIPEDYVTNASYYLSNWDGEEIEEQVRRIENSEDKNEYIDNIEGVSVWEPLEGKYTCMDFLDLIGK